ASASPPLRYPDLYGIDLPTRDEYIAHDRTVDQVRESIGADLLIYQDLEDLIEAVTRKGELKFKRPHCAYFDGQYPTAVTEEILNQIEQQRKLERAGLKDNQVKQSSLI
ncbi:MAG TPA: amidophosphoribosyltransferase, partial [Patescibacteria group bacterium]|nr:amidophosphoribosyltransferase [Patescibacteria group bacterium]